MSRVRLGELLPDRFRVVCPSVLPHFHPDSSASEVVASALDPEGPPESVSSEPVNDVVSWVKAWNVQFVQCRARFRREEARTI